MSSLYYILIIFIQSREAFMKVHFPMTQSAIYKNVFIIILTSYFKEMVYM